jgi:hypothetical protein
MVMQSDGWRRLVQLENVIRKVKRQGGTGSLGVAIGIVVDRYHYNPRSVTLTELRIDNREANGQRLVTLDAGYTEPSSIDRKTQSNRVARWRSSRPVGDSPVALDSLD